MREEDDCYSNVAKDNEEYTNDQTQTKLAINHHQLHIPLSTTATRALEQNRKLFSDTLVASSADTSLTKYHTLINNIEACIEIGDRMKSLLGPRSRDKLLVDIDNEVSVTNDGATALKSMNVSVQPAAKILVQVSSSMDAESGDGTTSVVVFASALLRHAMHLITNHAIHPQCIIRGYNIALQMALSVLESSNKVLLVRDFSPFEMVSRPILLQVANTCLNSKIATYLAPKLAQLAVDAIIKSGGSEKRVHVTRGGVSSDNPMSSGFRGGTSMNESYLLPGNSIMIPSKTLSSNTMNLSNVTIAVVTFPLDLPKGSSHQYRINVPSLTQLDRLIKEEESYIKKMVVNLKRIGVQVLFVQEQLSGIETALSDTAKHWLNRSKIQVLKPLPQVELDKLCTVFNVQPIMSSNQLDSLAMDKKNDQKEMLIPYLRTISRLYTHYIGEESYTVLTDFDQESKHEQEQQAVQSHSTVVLRASSQIAIEELDRALHDALRVLETLIATPKLVPGGGTCEIAAHTHLQLILDHDLEHPLIRELSSVERVAAHSFMQALEEIPLVLCSNSGLNPVSTLNQLKRLHRQLILKPGSSNETPKGIFIPHQRDPLNNKCGISDMFSHGIIEPLTSKMAQWQMATQAAIQLLKIDDIFVNLAK